MEFRSNLEQIESRITNACGKAGRQREEVTLMAVTKTWGPDAVDMAVAHGIEHIGENRVQEAAGKRPQTGVEAKWELIGPLQRNKVRLAVELFDRIQTLDRLKLIEALERHCRESGRRELPVLLEVNAGYDPAKHGVYPEDAALLLESVINSEILKPEGFMTIAPFVSDKGVIRNSFRTLRELRDQLSGVYGCPLPVLSMGMTGDLEIAIEEGSTLVRVGTALFGER